MLRRPTIVEAVTIGVIGIVLWSVMFGDVATNTRWKIQSRANNWKLTTVPTLSDAKLLTTEIDLAGEWIKHHRLEHSQFVFTKRADTKFDVQFGTRGCVGRCDFSRIASVSGGVITMDSAVAEYSPSAYNTLYAIHVGNVDYLVPANRLQEFEHELASGSDSWKWHVFSRGEETNEQPHAPEPAVGPDSNRRSSSPAQ